MAIQVLRVTLLSYRPTMYYLLRPCLLSHSLATSLYFCVVMPKRFRMHILLWLQPLPMVLGMTRSCSWMMQDGCGLTLFAVMQSGLLMPHDRQLMLSCVISVLLLIVLLVRSCRLSVCNMQEFRVEFSWPAKPRKAYHWVPHAALDLAQLGSSVQVENFAEGLWESKVKQQFDEAPDADTALCIFNEFAVDSLVGAGAQWRPGTRSRGTMPDFVFGDVNKSSGYKDAGHRELNVLDKTLRRFEDLSFKLDLCSLNPRAKQIAAVTWSRVVRVLRRLEITCPEEWPNACQLMNLWDAVFTARTSLQTQVRRKRFSDWRRRMRNSALSDRKDLFHFLKKKQAPPRHCTVCNELNQPIYHPQDALNFACQQWNGIFGCHQEEIPTEPILHIVQEGLSNLAREVRLPDLTAQDFRDASLARKKSSAPGMDGWRTSELHRLPLRVLAVMAHIWNAIEKGQWSLPKIFQAARLVMIPKAGAKSFEPISYRLISLLSGLYLSWSRARFKQLEDWQRAVFPRSLSGGIKGRHAADIYHRIGLQAEQAAVGRDPLVGIKLDRSKCFDRIVPHVVEALAIKLGCDKRVFVVWRQLYMSFERYLCLKSLIHPSPLANQNGVAQGDCFSVLAINIIMCAWHVVVSQIPNVTPSCFIDDAYLTSSLSNISMLQRAVQATELFDGLIGQQLNLGKSSSFGSNGTARKAMKSMFPGVPCTEIIGVLGAHIKMTRKSMVVDAASVFHVVKSLLLDIACLPVGFVHKAFLIAAKAVPMFTYAAELNPVPRLALGSLTKQVAHARPCGPKGLVGVLWTCCWGWPATQPGSLLVSLLLQRLFVVLLVVAGWTQSSVTVGYMSYN